MAMKYLAYLEAGFRMSMRNINVRLGGLPWYEGTPEDICEQILDRCFNGKYMQVSAGHFKDFYARDFSWIVRSLERLGYDDQVERTLSYAMERYKAKGRIKGTITPSGKVFDMPRYAPDSLASMCHSLTGRDALIEQYRDFLAQEIAHFISHCLDEGMIKPLHFSSMKDHVKRKQSCYDVCMAHMVQTFAGKYGFDFPDIDYREVLMEKYWTGEYFLDDLSGKRHIAGDAQIFPFWTGLITDKKIFDKIQATLREEGLDRPLPMRYTSHKDHDFIMLDLLTPNYEGTTCWAHMGICWLEVLDELDQKALKEELERFTRAVERYHNFLEVYDEDLTPYKSPFYYCDDSMSWCATYLEKLRKHPELL